MQIATLGNACLICLNNNSAGKKISVRQLSQEFHYEIPAIYDKKN